VFPSKTQLSIVTGPVRYRAPPRPSACVQEVKRRDNKRKQEERKETKSRRGEAKRREDLEKRREEKERNNTVLLKK